MAMTKKQTLKGDKTMIMDAFLWGIMIAVVIFTYIILTKKEDS